MLIKANQIIKDYGGHRVLEDISLQVNSNEKIGFVGKNGVGKTTLIKLLTGELSPDKGQIEKRNDISIGYLPQQPVFQSDDILYDKLKQVFNDIQELEKELAHLEAKMSQETNSKKLEGIMEKYSQKRDKFESKGGYQVDRNIRSILKGLGFSEAEFEKPLNKFSGGEKTRALLAQKLLQNPDILILDEPTNYLDLDGLSWLESYLSSYQQNFIIITHDRYFLENTVNVIWELTEEGLSIYNGNYSSYLIQKQQLEEKRQKEYEKQQKYIKRTQDFIRKNIEGQKTKQAQSRRKQLEKINLTAPPRKDPSLNLSLGTNQRSGEKSITLKNVTKYIQDQKLFPSLSCEIYRKDKVGIIGPNGSGKTSLLKIMAGHDLPNTGGVEYGSRVEVGYLDQEQDLLTPEYTLIEELRTEVPLEKEEFIRSILGRFLFSAWQMTDYVSNLSGGEQVRLKLAKLFIKKANLLLLDEPTNHLDIDGREALEDALFNFEGTLIIVSHDRYLLDKVANKIIHLSKEDVDIFSGNYTEYMQKVQKLAEAKKEEQKPSSKLSSKPSNSSKSSNRAKSEQQIEQQSELQIDELMEEIDELEARKQALETSLSDPELYKDGEKAQDTNVAYQEILAQLEEKYQQLETLV